MNNKEKIKQIKYLRFRPEERFVFDHLTDLEEYIHKNYLNSIFYKKDNVLLFQWDQNSGYFWCNYKTFWSILESKFNLNYEDIKDLVKIMVEDHLIKKDVTPFHTHRNSVNTVEDHLIKKDVTPVKTSLGTSCVVEDHLIKKDVTPGTGFPDKVLKVEDHLIKKDVTPITSFISKKLKVENHLFKKDYGLCSKYKIRTFFICIYHYINIFINY